MRHLQCLNTLIVADASFIIVTGIQQFPDSVL